MLPVRTAKRTAGGWMITLERADSPIVRLEPQEVQINADGEVSVVEFRTQQFVHLRFRFGDKWETVASAEALAEIISKAKKLEVKDDIYTSGAGAVQNGSTPVQQDQEVGKA